MSILWQRCPGGRLSPVTMPVTISETLIARRLKEAYRKGRFAEGAMAEAWQPTKPPICAAVLVPLAIYQGDWHLVLTRRTETVENHKGQVSFPGGACEPGESTPEQTALREAFEEIGLRESDVRLLGRLTELLTVSSFRIAAVVGVMPWPYPLRCACAEVQRVFVLPIKWLAERQSWEKRAFTHGGESRQVEVIQYKPYDGEILWGISAQITHNLLSAIGLLQH
jgi:8-oxo-dGTP pyrophosphatase MutT (NUDIX family)